MVSSVPNYPQKNQAVSQGTLSCATSAPPKKTKKKTKYGGQPPLAPFLKQGKERKKGAEARGRLHVAQKGKEEAQTPTNPLLTRKKPTQPPEKRLPAKEPSQFHESPPKRKKSRKMGHPVQAPPPPKVGNRSQSATYRSTSSPRRPLTSRSPRPPRRRTPLGTFPRR